jgi:hypothetical protein
LSEPPGTHAPLGFFPQPATMKYASINFRKRSIKKYCPNQDG